MHQNINKQKSRVVKAVCEPLFYLPMWLISELFVSSVTIQICQDQTLSKKSFNSSKKQISTISKTEWRTKLVDHKNSLLLFYSEIPTQKELSSTVEMTSSVVDVLCGFSTECLKTLRDFGLLFKNTMKTSCCFIVSFKW